MPTKLQKQEQEQAIAKLREWLKPGDTVTTFLKHRSASGMMRSIDVVICQQDYAGACVPTSIAWAVSDALGWRFDRDRGGVKVRGCGMDMGYHLVYTLSRVLFPDGFVPAEAGLTYGRNGAPADQLDPDGGYALKQRWL